MWTESLITEPTRGATITLGGNRLKFNRYEQSCGQGEAEVGGAVRGWEVNVGAEGAEGITLCAVNGQRVYRAPR